ncbi:MAG: universal stress protein [Alphaproteobacteria bacterium]
MIDKSTYLIVADDTEEFNNAMRFACKVAKANGKNIGVLYIMPDAGFHHWGNLEERIKQDRREDAERVLKGVTEKIRQFCGLEAVVYIGEGAAAEAVIKTIEDNQSISKLFLGGSTKAGGPGPLVSFFSGKGIGKLPVPLTIVPDHINVDL